MPNIQFDADNEAKFHVFMCPNGTSTLPKVATLFAAWDWGGIANGIYANYYGNPLYAIQIRRSLFARPVTEAMFFNSEVCFTRNGEDILNKKISRFGPSWHEQMGSTNTFGEQYEGQWGLDLHCQSRMTMTHAMKECNYEYTDIQRGGYKRSIQYLPALNPITGVWGHNFTPYERPYDSTPPGWDNPYGPYQNPQVQVQYPNANLARLLGEPPTTSKYEHGPEPDGQINAAEVEAYETSGGESGSIDSLFTANIHRHSEFVHLRGQNYYYALGVVNLVTGRLEKISSFPFRVGPNHYTSTILYWNEGTWHNGDSSFHAPFAAAYGLVIYWPAPTHGHDIGGFGTSESLTCSPNASIVGWYMPGRTPMTVTGEGSQMDTMSYCEIQDLHSWESADNGMLYPTWKEYATTISNSGGMYRFETEGGAATFLSSASTSTDDYYLYFTIDCYCCCCCEPYSHIDTGCEHTSCKSVFAQLCWTEISQGSGCSGPAPPCLDGMIVHWSGCTDHPHQQGHYKVREGTGGLVTMGYAIGKAMHGMNHEGPEPYNVRVVAESFGSTCAGFGPGIAYTNANYSWPNNGAKYGVLGHYYGYNYFETPEHEQQQLNPTEPAYMKMPPMATHTGGSWVRFHAHAGGSWDVNSF